MKLSNSVAALFDSPSSGAAAMLQWRPAHAVMRALRLLLPQACALCAFGSGNALLCPGCLAALPRLRTACPRCALPSFSGAICGACLARPPPFSAAVSAWVYAFPIDRLLHAFKYGGRLALAEPFAEALCAALADRGGMLPDLVVPLPLARARQRERGFNQAHEIARRVARARGLALAHGLARTRDSPPQAALAWNARARNVRDAFVADPWLRGKRVAIVDDVMTTGATLAAAAAAARRAGAIDVEAWVVARTLPPGQSAASP